MKFRNGDLERCQHLLVLFEDQLALLLCSKGRLHELFAPDSHSIPKRDTFARQASYDFFLLGTVLLYVFILMERVAHPFQGAIHFCAQVVVFSPEDVIIVFVSTAPPIGCSCLQDWPNIER